MSSPNEVDDLDALLDDAMNTMDEEERRHQEEIQARDVARENETKNATSNMPDPEMNDMLRLLESFIGGDNTNGSDDPEVLISNIKKEMANLVGMLDSASDVSADEQEKINEVRELIGKLDEIPMDISATTNQEEPDGKTPENNDEQKILASLYRSMRDLQPVAGEHSNEGTAASNDAVPSAENIPDNNIADMFLNVILDPQFGTPLRHMRDCYTQWFAVNTSNVDAGDMERYKKQHKSTIEICKLLDEGPVDRGDSEKVERLMTLLHGLSDLGMPPENLPQFAPADPTQSV